MTKTPNLAEHREQFLAEFDSIEDQLMHALAEMSKLMHTYRMNTAGLIDAQDHALASVRACRKVAASIDPAAKAPASTRPQQWPGTLAEQLETHRVAVAQTMALVECMPGTDRQEVNRITEGVCRHLQAAERIARTHQPARRPY